MQIKIHYKKSHFELDVPAEISVKDVKQKLSEMESMVPAERQKMIWKGKILADTDIISDSMKKILLMELPEIIDTKEIRPCLKECGFYGTYVTQWYCSKCYEEYRKEACQRAHNKLMNMKRLEIAEESLEVAEVSNPAQTNAERCWKCERRVGLLGFKCRCSYVFCKKHRMANQHDCSYDWKTWGREQIRKTNKL